MPTTPSGSRFPPKQSIPSASPSTRLPSATSSTWSSTRTARSSPRCRRKRSGSRTASRSSRSRCARAAGSIFIGAGTSGRLGVVEAAEMPPTFGTLARRWCRRSWPAARRRSSRPRKASRTTTRKARRSIARLRLTNSDVVIGVSASGMTPFVRGGLTRGAQGRREDHLRHLLARLRAAELRRPASLRRRSGPRSSPARRGSRPAPRPRWC